METPVRLEKWCSGFVTLTGAGRPAPKKQEPPSSGKYGFNLHFIRGLLKLIPHGEKRDILLVLLLFGLVAANMYVGSLSGSVTGRFYKVIVDKNVNEFKQVLWQASIVVILSSLFESAIKFALDIIGFRWRKALVSSIHKRYFSHSMFYQILHLDHTIDNPDQRIAQDLDLLTQSMAKVLRVVFEAPLTIGFYGYLTIRTITWYSPLLVLGYWLIAFCLNKLLMNPSVAAVFRQEQLEGNFRFQHLRVRTYAESIALYGGSEKEREISNESFAAAMRNRFRLISWETCVTAATNIFAYFASVINYAIVSLPIFQGWKLPSSAGDAAAYVSVASFRLLMLINGFTQLNNASRDFSDFIGYSNRISQMFEVMDTLAHSDVTKHLNDVQMEGDFAGLSTVTTWEEKTKESGEVANFTEISKQSDELEDVAVMLSVQEEQPDSSKTKGSPAYQLPTSPYRTDAVIFSRFSGYTPAGQTLVKNLNLEVAVGCNLLISGPSGSGKTSLLRCLSGLWRTFDGQIHRPSSTFFLPQRPYLPFGSLQDQIIYPLTSESVLSGEAPSENGLRIEADRLWTVLQAVDLGYLLYRPHACGFSTMETRESIRDLIEDQETDAMNETTQLLSASAQAARLHGILSNTMKEIESSNLNWTEVLSPGEQQRIGLARVLYHKPRFAILDEATSCVDEPMEAKFYAMCKELKITLITIGHRSSLHRFHQRKLTLDRKGNWELRQLQSQQD